MPHTNLATSKLEPYRNAVLRIKDAAQMDFVLMSMDSIRGEGARIPLSAARTA